jgi:hypothetical protein
MKFPSDSNTMARCVSRASLAVAHRTGAIEIKVLERVAVDTTLQEKAITHPQVLCRYPPGRKLLSVILRVRYVWVC